MLNKRNLIILMIDGGRPDFANNSSFFNKLKENSLHFSQSITYGPHTITAMHAIFSGCYGFRTGTNSYWSTFKFKKDRFKTITEYLKENNYYTICDIVNELVIPKQGFDEFLIHDELKDDLTLKHKDLLKQCKKLNENEMPFFIYLQYSNIHTGIMNDVLKVYDNFSKEYFDNKQKNKDRYEKLFQHATEYLEKIVSYIKSLDIDKNSLILIMSDHGISIGEKVGERAYGAFCYDYTLKTFTYFLSDDLPSKIINQQIRTIDFMPTILEYFGILLDKNFESLDGVSLFPLIKDEKLNEYTAFSETGNPLTKKQPPMEPNTKSIRTSKWKLIFNEYNNTKELYDLENDPNEENNLSENGFEIEKTLWIELSSILDHKHH